MSHFSYTQRERRRRRRPVIYRKVWTLEKPVVVLQKSLSYECNLGDKVSRNKCHFSNVYLPGLTRKFLPGSNWAFFSTTTSSFSPTPPPPLYLSIQQRTKGEKLTWHLFRHFSLYSVRSSCCLSLLIWLFQKCKQHSIVSALASIQ